jgi:hypothetical protein
VLQIITRTEWGAKPWPEDKEPHIVPPGQRRYFVVHYDGAAPVTREGASIPRAIDVTHRNKGWAGIGYNFVVDQLGTVYEGRGWDRVGAHCPGRNRDGIGVQIAVGGNQQPSDAAKHAVRALYEWACDRAGRRLNQTWHGAQYPTKCPGDHVIAWARAGMPDPTPHATTHPQEDDMAMNPQDRAALIADITRSVADAVTGIGARHPVLVDDGTGSAELPGGREVDALPTVVGEIQHELRAVAGKLDELLAAVRALGAAKS